MIPRSNLNIAYIGVGIFPFRVAGDKNFLLDLNESMSKDEVKTLFISLSEKSVAIGNHPSYSYIPRSFHDNSDKYLVFEKELKPIAFHHKHKTIREFLELSITLILNKKKIANKLEGFNTTIIHWADMSLLVPIIKTIFPCYKLTFSMLRIVSRSKIIDKVTGFCINFADAIITSTNASGALLIKFGVNRSKIHIAPWGYKEYARKENIKHEDGKTHLLWSGFIQQIGEEDLFKTIIVAKKVLTQRRDIVFHFLLKPESYRNSYLGFQEEGIIISKGDRNFIDILGGFDGMLSPVLLKNSSLAPPLTWIESLAAGVPIITTETLGINELIDNGVSGLILSDYDKLTEWLITFKDIKKYLKTMSGGAKNIYRDKYSIAKVSQNYINVYRSIIS